MLRAPGQSLADWCRVLYQLRLIAHHCVDTRCLPLGCASSRLSYLAREFWCSLLLSWRVDQVMLRSLASTFTGARYKHALGNSILFPSYSRAFFAISRLGSSSISLVAQLAWRGFPWCPGIVLQLMHSLGGHIFHWTGFRVVSLLRVQLHVGNLR